MAGSNKTPGEEDPHADADAVAARDERELREWTLALLAELEEEPVTHKAAA